jgi:prepilin-type N-terminal cleavage/methylation domain-containing protein
MMNRAHPQGTRRSAFTLIELMIVIVIIGLLVALITAASFWALRTAKRNRNRAEISQLEVALEQFKSRFGFYPPSRLKLAEVFNATNYPNAGTSGTLDADSVQYLTTMFPRMVNTWQTTGIDWNGNNLIDAGFVILEGDQCLVFFLGGIPGQCPLTTPPPTPVSTNPPTVLGFSTNPSNPAFATTDRIGPFFDFNTSRLVILQPAQYPATNANDAARSLAHYSYLDTYGSSNGLGTLASGQPYAYFSAYNNGIYHRYWAATAPFSDCVWLNTWPWAQTTVPQYWKPDTFQIISAGADSSFGTGSVITAGPPVAIAPTWTAATCTTVCPEGSVGYDDQGNFTGALLGVGQD